VGAGPTAAALLTIPLTSPAMPTSFEIDPREAQYFVQELVYRLAVRALSARCRGDRQFRLRTETLILQFGKDLPAVIEEAEKLSADLAASVSGR
jgi:hypothetical protein